MKTFTSALPEITLKYKAGTVKKFQVTCSQDTDTIFREVMNADTLQLQEEFCVIFLNNSNKSLGWYRVSTGGITGTLVDARLVMATALQSGATAMILGHNHPSGSLKPSQADKNITNKLKQAGEFLDIRVLDHIIITPDNGYYSFADEGIL